MLTLDEYRGRFENIKLDRTDTGILTVQLQTRGGPFVYGAQSHAELSWIFRCVADDTENRVVIFTGTGDSFWSLVNPPSFAHYQQTPQGWDLTLFEERRALEGFLAIDVPIIAAVNGPALIHSHLAVMADIVIASENAVFADGMHVPFGIVPGDGAHIVWPLLLGMNRGRYFLLTGQKLGADDALGLGVISEVVAPEALQSRAMELATDLAAKPTLMLRQTRSVLRSTLDQLITRDLSRGMMHEALAGLALVSEHLKDEQMTPRPSSEYFIVDVSTGETRPFS
ncbi:MAG: camK [Pseudonocardiales bacterium]|nr:camK [Pseudonocardiales bacterium]